MSSASLTHKRPEACSLRAFACPWGFSVPCAFPCACPAFRTAQSRRAPQTIPSVAHRPAPWMFPPYPSDPQGTDNQGGRLLTAFAAPGLPTGPCFYPCGANMAQPAPRRKGYPCFSRFSAVSAAACSACFFVRPLPSASRTPSRNTAA